MKKSLFYSLLLVLFTAFACDQYKEQYNWEKYQQQLAKPVSGVSVSPNVLTMRIGGAEMLTATVSPAAAANKQVVWYVDNPTIAGVDNNGLVTALAAGETIVTVETVEGKFRAECLVTVISESTVPVTGVQLDKSTLDLETGANFTLTASVKPVNATNRGVSWSSNDNNVATVSNLGQVTAVAAGTAIITVTTDEGSFTADCTVTVTDPAPVPTNDCYVTVSGAGSKNGTSWSNAMSCAELVSMLQNHDALDGKTVMMAGGTYVVSLASDKCLKLTYTAETTASFKGGYNAATGTRDSTAPTVFSGSNQWGIFSIAKNAKFSFDGIEFAHALVPPEQTTDETQMKTVHGAFYIDSKSTEVSFNNCYFHDNVEHVDHKIDSLKGGPAIFLKAGTVKLNNCLFKNNTATSRGGALRTVHKDGVLFANNCKFITNKIYLEYGTSVNTKGNVAFHNCLFYGGTSYGASKNAPELNVNYNYILASCTVVQSSAITGGTGTIRSETETNSSTTADAGYAGWYMNNVIYNYSTAEKAWGVLFSKVGAISAGYNGFVGLNGGISHSSRFSLADTDKNVKSLDLIGPTSYSFNDASNTITWNGSFNFTRATDNQVYDALNSYVAYKGKTTLGSDFRTWLREIGAL